ncbi:MAG: polysaccharide pyruvyl transferase family protein, partial [Acidimicrobiia bacterium]
GVADIAAAVSGAAVFVGSSLHGAITALAYGRPFVVCNLAGESKLDGFADLTGLERRLVRHPGALGTAIEAALTVAPPAALLPGLRRRVDDHFDRIAVLAETSAARRRAGEKPRPWPLERLDREAVASYTLARSRLAGVSGPGTGRETGLGTTKCTRTENRMSQPSAG